MTTTYEVHGCRNCRRGEGEVEQVPDEQATFWTVYRRDSYGQLEALHDYPTRLAAEIKRDMLASPVGHLDRAEQHGLGLKVARQMLETLRIVEGKIETDTKFGGVLLRKVRATIKEVEPTLKALESLL